MSELVEGSWKNFEFKMITSENKAQIYNHLAENFYEDEPICKYFGGNSDLCRKEYEEFYDSVIPLNLSFFAANKDTKEIATVRMTTIHRRGSHFSNIILQSPQLSNTFRVVMDDEAQFFTRFGVDEVANFVTASTSRKYRGHGLASEMYRRSITFLRARGYKYVKSVITSPYTRKALVNLGFEEGAKIYFKDFKGKTGQPMFPDLSDDDFVNWMYLKL